MQCINPVHIQDDTGFLKVPCGKCRMCKIARVREWTLRCVHELDTWNGKAVFATLTYNDEEIPKDLQVSKHVLRSFVKRLRKRLEPRKIRVFACGEYGEITGRPHYHLIIFNVSLEEHVLELINPNDETKGFKCFGGPVKSAWNHGFVVLGTVTRKSAQYCVKYIEKTFDKEWNKEIYGDIEPPFKIQSPGLGREYALEHKVELLRDLACRVNGVKIALPKYYQRILLTTESDKKRFYKKAQEAEEKGRHFWEKKGYTEGWQQNRKLDESRLAYAKQVIAWHDLYQKITL